jgi:hypothetical protein
MNPETPEKKPKRSGPPPLSALKITTVPLLRLTAMAPHIRGEEHKTHGIYIVGGKIRDEWALPGQYCFTSQRRDEKYVVKIEINLIASRDNSQEGQFEGTLENGSYKELYKDQFIRALIQKVREHGHESFFAIEKGNSKVHDLPQYHHMFTVAEAIDSYEKRVHPTVTRKYSYEEI